MNDSHLIHHCCHPLCLLIGSPLFTQEQLSVQHCQVILTISMCQLTSQHHIQRTLTITFWQSSLWLQVTERFFWEIVFILIQLPVLIESILLLQLLVYEHDHGKHNYCPHYKNGEILIPPVKYKIKGRNYSTYKGNQTSCKLNIIIPLYNSLMPL